MRFLYNHLEKKNKDIWQSRIDLFTQDIQNNDVQER